MAKEKKPKLSGRTLDKLYEAYDNARRTAKEADNAKKDAADEIKTLLGETQEASTPNYIVTYKYDKDTETEVFDEERFMLKDSNGYQAYQKLLNKIEQICKKYTKKVVTKGARKLIVMAVEETE